MAILLCFACIATYGLGQDAFDRPAKVDSILESSSMDTHSFGPLGNAKAFAVECQYRLRATVAGLFLACRPAAIVRRVVAVVIAAVDLVRLRRAFSHVVQKRLKRFTPTIAYRNASTAVARVADVARRFASPNHRTPTLVCRRFVHAVGSATLGCDFAMKAATALFGPSPQNRAVGSTFRAAITPAMPDQQLSASTPSKPGDHQTAKPFTGQVTRIVKGWSGRYIVNDRRVVGSFHLTRLVKGFAIAC